MDFSPGQSMSFTSLSLFPFYLPGMVIAGPKISIKNP